MEPATSATVTAAVVRLALEAAKEVAPQAVKDTWAQVKKWLGWHGEPTPDEITAKVQAQLQTDAELVARIDTLLRHLSARQAGSLVGTVYAKKSVVAGRIERLTM